MDFYQVSSHCLLLFIVVSTEIFYYVLVNFIPPSRKLYLRAHGCAADPSDHKPVSAECPGDDGTEAVQSDHIYNQVADMSVQK